MDVLHARMYRLTNDDTYKQRAINTATAILNTYADSNGGFLDDRDGWTNGHFVRDWIIEVYPLLSSNLQRKALDMFNRTASAVAASDRTSDGYYGAAWNGPLNSAWDKIGTIPQQIMTSATAIDFVAAPALISANIPVPITPPQPTSCVWNGQTIANGQSVTAYQASSVPYGQMCISQLRTCTNGILSGAYTNTSCTVQPAPLSITASLLGQTGEDVVSPLSEMPDGVKDVHIRFANVVSPISWVRITTADAGWEAPPNGTDWIVALRPETNPTIVDAYFDFLKQYSSYTINLKVADGRTATVQAVASWPQIAASLLGQTGEDIAGMKNEVADGIKDVHVRLTGVTTSLSRVRITTADGGWEWPSNGTDWIVALRPESDPTVIDLYFDFLKQYSSYTVAMTFTNGLTETITAQ